MKRTQNKRRSNVAISLLLLSVAFGVPMALASYLLNAASAPPPLTVLGGETTIESSAAGSSQTASASGATRSPLVNGVLYTNGPVEVNWGGVQIPVENTTYAFSGGELISTASNAMGILKLDSGSMVFICPNSRVRVSRRPSGETLLEVMAGSGRFMFEENDAFRVEVNNITLSAAPDGSGDGFTRHAYTGESVATEDGGCVACNLSKNIELSVDHGSTKKSAIAKGGQILSVSGPGAQNPISRLKLPANVFAGMREAMVSNGATGLGYLCKCLELKDYAEHADERLAGQPDLTLSTALARKEDGPDGPASDTGPTLTQPPDTRPAVAPPPVPDVTVADTGAPDPFVPGLLPAVGEAQPQTNTNVVVPPPLVPGSGSGGGGTVSSS